MSPRMTTKTGRAGGVPGAADTLKGLGIGAAITAVIAVVLVLVTQHPEQRTSQALTITSAPASPSYTILPDAELFTDEGSDHTGRPYIESAITLTVQRLDNSSRRSPELAIVGSDPVTGESFRCEVGRGYLWSDDQMTLTAGCDTTVPHERVSAFTVATVEDTRP